MQTGRKKNTGREGWKVCITLLHFVCHTDTWPLSLVPLGSHSLAVPLSFARAPPVGLSCECECELDTGSWIQPFRLLLSLDHEFLVVTDKGSHQVKKLRARDPRDGLLLQSIGTGDASISNSQLFCFGLLNRCVYSGVHFPDPLRPPCLRMRG